MGHLSSSRILEVAFVNHVFPLCACVCVQGGVQRGGGGTPQQQQQQQQEQQGGKDAGLAKLEQGKECRKR